MKINNLLGQYGGATATHLTAQGYAHANETLDMLVHDQTDAAVFGDAVCAIPLAWVALASSVGLTVDRDGRIVDGPKSNVTERYERRYYVAHRVPEEVSA